MFITKSKEWYIEYFETRNSTWSVAATERRLDTSQQMENMKRRLGDDRRNGHWAWQFRKLSLRMVEVALPLALKILEKWKNLNMCFLPGSSYHGLYLKSRIPKRLLLLVSTENTGWSGHSCPKFQENREHVGKPKVFLKEQGRWG